MHNRTDMSCRDGKEWRDMPRAMERNKVEEGEAVSVIWVPNHTLDPNRSQEEVADEERKLAKARRHQGWNENLRRLNQLADFEAGKGVGLNSVSAQLVGEARRTDDLTQRMLEHMAGVVACSRRTRYQ